MSDARPQALRVALRAADPVRRGGLAALVQGAGHVLAEAEPDVVLLDLDDADAVPAETEAPVVVLSDRASLGRDRQLAGVLPRAVRDAALDAALRAAAAGLLVRSPAPDRPTRATPDGFQPAEEQPGLLTPREVEILGLVGEGMSNKEAARRLGISAHTVKFHLEAVFAKLGAGSRAEAVAKGLRGGVIEL
jgi:DNA-binding NarL/FixJ family response regulator